jgi:hypothetical protein
MALLERLRNFVSSEGDKTDTIPVILRRDYDEHAALPEVRERMARVAQRRQQGAGHYRSLRRQSS